FAEKWADVQFLAFFPFGLVFFPFFGFSTSETHQRPWLGPRAYAVLGLARIAIAQLLARRRRYVLASAERPYSASAIMFVRIEVLAVQGTFREHAAMLRRLGVEAVEVRKPEQLQDLDGLVIPGGESTTFMRLMRLYGLDEAVREFTGPVLGTCAGMI